MHLAACPIIPCWNYDANGIDSHFPLVCNISDTDFIDNEVRFGISRLGVVEFSASLIQSEYSDSGTVDSMYGHGLNVKSNRLC